MTERRTRVDGRETMARVLEHARKELDDVGAVQFNILRVIENAEVSRSSVYHHFGDRNGVIAAVEVQRLIDEMKSLNEGIRAFISIAESREQVLAAVRTVLVNAGTEAGRAQRAHRIGVMAAAQGIPLLAETFQREQAIGDKHLADSLTFAAERKLIRRPHNAEGVAHFINSLFIGRSIVDALASTEADEAWINATMVALEALLPQ